MKQKEEFVHPRPGMGRTWLMVCLLYVLLLLWLEPIIDFILGMLSPVPDPAAIEAFNQRKAYVTHIVFGIARSLPILLFLYFGFRVMVSQKLPPPGTPVPITLRLLQGPQVRFYGMFIVGLSLMLLLREVRLLTGV